MHFSNCPKMCFTYGCLDKDLPLHLGVNVSSKSSRVSLCLLSLKWHWLTEEASCLVEHPTFLICVIAFLWLQFPVTWQLSLKIWLDSDWTYLITKFQREKGGVITSSGEEWGILWVLFSFWIHLWTYRLLQIMFYSGTVIIFFWCSDHLSFGQ